MKKFIVILVASLWSVFASAAPDETRSAQLRIIRLEPTVLFPRREPLAQVARLTVANEGTESIRCDVVVTTTSGAQEKMMALEFVPDRSTVEVLVPDVSALSKVTLELRQGPNVVAHYEQDWQPQRKWKVYVIKSSHEDIGYENYIFKKQREIAEFIDLAREIARPRVIDASGAKRNVGFHYVMETLLFQRNYIEERGERAYRELVERDVKRDGGLSLMAAPSGVHTHWMDYEEIARIGYPARRETRDRFGLDLDTVMMVDNPSLSWSGMQAFAASGIKYVGRWGQGWRTGGNNSFAKSKLPALFWWEAPDGEHRVLLGWTPHYGMLFWWGQTNGGYGDFRELEGPAALWVDRYLKTVESGEEKGPYPYDAVVMPNYQDHETPKFDERNYRAFREKYAYPEIKFDAPRAFFAYIEKNYGGQLPTLRGDLNNFSADYSSIDPESQGWKRTAARLLPVAEGLGVLASSTAPAFALPLAEVERTYTRLYDYDEHSWPTLPQISDEQLFNAAWVKKAEARRALDAAGKLFDLSARALSAQIFSPGEGSFAVFNPLLHRRTDLVEVEGNAPSVVDLRTGTRIVSTPVGAGRISFLATDIPAFGYALFKLDDAAAPVETGELKADALSISNRYYTLRFDGATGAIASIQDRTTGAELVDPAAPYKANQLVYVHKNGRETLQGFEYSPVKATRLESSIGPGQVRFDVWIEDPKLGGRIQQTVTLHAQVKRIEITNTMKAITAMWAKTYEDRYCDNLFVAFPFAVPGGQIRAEYPGGVVRPFDDQLRWGSHDYLTANRWIDVSTSKGGVTLASREASAFSLGEIRYNRFSIDYKPTRPWLFSYAWSNRMAGLLTLNPDECDATLHYSITSHEGDWNSGAAVAHGWQAGSPLLAFPVVGVKDAPWRAKQQSFLSTDATNVQLTVLKQSGQAGRGWVARFVETDGRAAEFEVDVSTLRTEKAFLCDLVEDDLKPLIVRAGKVRVPIKAFGFATVRLLAAVAPDAAPEPQVKAVTDSEVQLVWSPVAGAGGAYNVFRSDDPKAPATVYSLVGRTSIPSFTDRGLKLASEYSYYVAAVTAGNEQGPLSSNLVARTSADNRTAPAIVSELGVVRRAPDTLIVYWRQNPDHDLARYRVFRSEEADFSIDGREPLAVLESDHYFLQVYRDTGLVPGKTYYYRVQAVDWANNVQPVAPLTSATTPKDQR